MWQLLATSPEKLGFIPPIILNIGQKGMVTNSRHMSLRGDQVVVYKVLDPLYDGTNSQRCVVAPCWIEDNSHTSAKRNKENPLSVVIKYSTSEKSEKEIETEVCALEKFLRFNKKVNINQKDPL